MRRLWLTLLVLPALLGGGAAAAAAAPDGGDSAAGMRLTRMGSCAELAAYGLEHALPLVGPSGLWDSVGRLPLRPRAVQFSVVPQGRAFSTTNVQEEGIDEPDLVKTDGEHLFVVVGAKLRVLRLARDLRPVAEVPLPLERTHELLLRGDSLIVLSVGGSRPSWLPGGFRRPTRYVSETTITEFDVSRAARPVVARTLTMTGAYVAARMHGGIVRVVTVSSVPAAVPFENPTRWDDAGRSAATARNRQLLAAAPAEDWLPSALFVDVRRGRIEHRPLVECRHVWRPHDFSGLGLTAVTTLDVDGGLELVDSDAVFSDAEIVYASHDSLFVATERWRDRPVQGAPLRAPRGTRTLLHKFGIGGRVTRYRGSGAVEGYLMNQWSLSEHDGVLRVASTQRPTWWDWPTAEDEQSSFVTALVEQGGKLVPVGRVSGLGRGERVYAVRFSGEIGYVVTFRRTDPLYTVDLSRPTRPVVRGELVLPGYSAYLHPVGPHLLLGVGQAGGGIGQLSLFDVSDTRRPKRLFNRLMGKAMATAETDHRAFLYWPPAKLAVVPASLRDQFGSFSAALAYRIERDAIEPVGRVLHGDGELLRSVVVGDSLFTISTSGVKESGLGALVSRDWVPFEPAH